MQRGQEIGYLHEMDNRLGHRGRPTWYTLLLCCLSLRYFCPSTFVSPCSSSRSLVSLALFTSARRTLAAFATRGSSKLVDLPWHATAGEFSWRSVGSQAD